ncbi:hypothetical protein [Xanthomonas sp. 3498]|uniref:hypothetical protein n=1 Tax=Xanthomonas sp. 3498 TaxID=2663863 RepID=UPI00161EEDA3|nr:hypothetical protein [Xanthomonas sp. 3498]MBB5875877.1 hypothetical protein [Xanthomonas sp. 3498]
MNNMVDKAVAESPCPWETGELGTSIAHAYVAPSDHGSAVDDALGLQMISLRLQKKLIADLKLIAEAEGLGYQPLIRRVLMRFAAAEFRNRAHGKLAPTLSDFGGSPDCDEEVPQMRVAVG